jgi:hypothetical protein
MVYSDCNLKCSLFRTIFESIDGQAASVPGADRGIIDQTAILETTLNLLLLAVLIGQRDSRCSLLIMTSLVSIQMGHILVDDTVGLGVVDPRVVRVERSPLSRLRYLG